MEVIFTIKVGDKEVTLTEDEARSLYLKLDEMYGSKVSYTPEWPLDLPTKWPDPIITCTNSRAT